MGLRLGKITTPCRLLTPKVSAVFFFFFFFFFFFLILFLKINLNLGFSDVDGSDDLMLQKLILDFVKRGISSLSMVLVAIPVNHELAFSDIKCILSAIEFLGAKFRPITYILGTHSEGWTIDDKREWATQLKKTKLRELLRFTSKFVWSGMIPPQISGTERETMLLGLKENQEKVVLKAIQAKPIPILNQGGDNVMQLISRFEAQESAIKDGMILDDILPQIEPLVEQIRFESISLLQFLPVYSFPLSSSSLFPSFLLSFFPSFLLSFFPSSQMTASHNFFFFFAIFSEAIGAAFYPSLKRERMQDGKSKSVNKNVTLIWMTLRNMTI